MAGTLEVIKFRDLIKLSAITRVVPGITPVTIELKGEDLSSVEQVFINDVEVKEFVLINRTTLYAQFPSTVKVVRTVEVVSNNFTRTADASKVEFRVGTHPRRVSGILRLTQHFCAWLLKSPGSDLFSPNDGGGLQDIASVIGSTHQTEPLLAAVARSVSTTSDQLRRAQLQTPGLPLNERLLAAVVLDLHMVRELDEARIRLQLESVAGDEAISAITL